MASGEGSTMPDSERVEQVEYGDSPWYRWTIRTLYAVAIGLNVWLLWQQTQDDAEVEILKAKAKRFGNKLLAPFHLERKIQRETGPMLWEAERIVEAADG